MAVVTIRQLLDSGVHFGHQTRRWNPKVKRFILAERSGIHIIDLQQSLAFIDRAYDFVKETVAHGGTILFVGTKKQAQGSIAEQATRVGQPYVNQRWLGGLLTNFQTVSKRLARMKEPEEIDFDDTTKGFTKKEPPHQEARAGQAPQDPRWYPQPHADPERALDRRHEEGAPRRRRGAEARDPDHRHPRHQLRPGRDHVPDPGQRRRDPLRRPPDPHRRRRRGRGPEDPPQRRQRRRGHRAARRVGAGGSSVASARPRPPTPLRRARPSRRTTPTRRSPRRRSASRSPTPTRTPSRPPRPRRPRRPLPPSDHQGRRTGIGPAPLPRSPLSTHAQSRKDACQWQTSPHRT